MSENDSGRVKVALTEEDNEEGDTLYEQKWNTMFKRLKDFKAQHGHCRVPNRHPEDPQLGNWVSTQRRQYRILTSGQNKAVPLTRERAQQLIAIGFEWSAKDPSHKSWEGRFQELCEYKTKHGSTLVPMGWKENPRLATWVSTQRQEYKQFQAGTSSRLNEEKVKRLNDVGFVWEAQRGRRKLPNPLLAMQAEFRSTGNMNPPDPEGHQAEAVSIETRSSTGPQEIAPSAPGVVGWRKDSGRRGVQQKEPHAQKSSAGDAVAPMGEASTPGSNMPSALQGDVLKQLVLASSRDSRPHPSDAMATGTVELRRTPSSSIHYQDPLGSLAQKATTRTSSQPSNSLSTEQQQLVAQLMAGALKTDQASNSASNQPATSSEHVSDLVARVLASNQPIAATPNHQNQDGVSDVVARILASNQPPAASNRQQDLLAQLVARTAASSQPSSASNHQQDLLAQLVARNAASSQASAAASDHQQDLIAQLFGAAPRQPTASSNHQQDLMAQLVARNAASSLPSDAPSNDQQEVMAQLVEAIAAKQAPTVSRNSQQDILVSELARALNSNSRSSGSVSTNQQQDPLSQLANAALLDGERSSHSPPTGQQQDLLLRLIEMQLDASQQSRQVQPPAQSDDTALLLAAFAESNRANLPNNNFAEGDRFGGQRREQDGGLTSLLNTIRNQQGLSNPSSTNDALSRLLNSSKPAGSSGDQAFASGNSLLRPSAEQVLRGVWAAPSLGTASTPGAVDLLTTEILSRLEAPTGTEQQETPDNQNLRERLLAMLPGLSQEDRTLQTTTMQYSMPAAASSTETEDINQAVARSLQDLLQRGTNRSRGLSQQADPNTISVTSDDNDTKMPAAKRHRHE